MAEPGELSDDMLSTQNDDEPLLQPYLSSSPITNSHSDTNQRTWIRVFKIIVLIGPIFILRFTAIVIAQMTLTEYNYKYFADQVGFNISFADTDYCHINKTDPNYQKQVQVQQKATQLQIFFSLATILSMYGPLLLNEISKRTSKFWALGCNISLQAIGYVGFLCITRYHQSPYYSIAIYLLIGALGDIEGILTILGALYPVVVPRHKLGILQISTTFYVNISIFFGFRYISGVTEDFETPMQYAALVVIALLMYLPVFAWLLPAPLPRIDETETEDIDEHCDSQQQSQSIQTNKTDNIFKSVTKTRPKNKHLELWILLTIMVSMSFIWGRTSLDSLYALNQPFCMSAMQLGKIGMIGSSVNLASMVVYAAVEAAFPGNVLFWFYVCAVINLCRYATYTLAQTVPAFFAQAVLGGMFTDCIAPIARAEVNKIGTVEEQGNLSAAYSVLNYGFFAFGQVTHLIVYDYAVEFFSKLPLLVLDAPVCLGLVSCVVFFHVVRRTS